MFLLLLIDERGIEGEFNMKRTHKKKYIYIYYELNNVSDGMLKAYNKSNNNNKTTKNNNKQILSIFKGNHQTV